MKIVKLVIFVLFSLMFINAGLNKFFMYMPMPKPSEEQMKIFGAFMTLSWLMPLVAVAEITGGILCLFNKTRALGAIIILPVMVGILLHHCTFERDELLMPLALFVINLWMIFDNWKKYQPMVA